MELLLLFLMLPGFAIFAIIGGVFGRARGRVGAGVFFSLLLGPIGWFIIFFGPDKRARCIHCSEVIQPDAQVCCHCGRTPFITAAYYQQEQERRKKMQDPVADWEVE